MDTSVNVFSPNLDYTVDYETPHLQDTRLSSREMKAEQEVLHGTYNFL